ncbi:MAG: H(+)-transporting ATPase [Polyangiaceae bacterium]
MMMSTAAETLHASVKEGAVNVDFDSTVIVQMVLFTILAVMLKPILFDPMLKLFAEREKRIEGAKLEARKTDDASAQALKKYEDAMAAARAAAGAEREKLRAEGQKAENEILTSVRASTAKTLENGRKQTGGEAAQVRTDLGPQVKILAADLATRALGREVRS